MIIKTGIVIVVVTVPFLIEVEKLKETNPNDPRIAELTNDAKNWQIGGLLLDSVAGILSGPNTNGAIGTIAQCR